MLANLIANIATLVNLEFGGVKYWRMVFGSPKFSPAKILRYTVVLHENFLIKAHCIAGANMK